MTKKLFLTVALFAAAAAMFVGCKKDDEKEPTYMVQVTAAEGGTVEGQNGEYKYGDVIVFTAIPADGYFFSKWSDGNTDNPRNVKVLIRKDIALVAQFVKCQSVTVTAGSNGTVTGSDNGLYVHGESLTFTAIPSDGYYFCQWSDGNTENPRTINVSASDITLEAQFAKIAFVTVTAGSNGIVSGSDNGRYIQGDTLVFTATPSDGYYFSQWSDNNTANPRIIIVSTNDIIFEAQFAQNPLITVVAGANGTVAGPDNGHYAPGEILSFTATPSDGYYFSQWSDGNTDTPRTIIVGTEDVAITAEFVTVTVDLGLTSGNLWTTRNLGATTPWDYGKYYAWGETKTKSNYDWNNYKYYNYKDSNLMIQKYNNEAEYGIVDNKTVLEPADDVATVELGADYSMPTIADWRELFNECYWVYTNDYNNQNVRGYIVYQAKADSDKGIREGTPSAFYSLSDTHIFFPGAGHRDEDPFLWNEGVGYYWSSSLDESYPWDAQYSQLDRINHVSRNEGCSVRPVKRP